MRIHRGILATAISGALLFGIAGAALAAPAVATSNVNVRSGPGTGYGAVDTLIRGTRVDVQGCQGGWCYVVKSGPDGWVSWQYLAELNRPTRPSTVFQFNFGKPPRYEPPRRPGPSRPGPSRPGHGRPGDNGHGPGGHGPGDNWHGRPGNDHGNGGRPGHNGPGAGPGNGRPDGRPCVIGAPGCR